MTRPFALIGFTVFFVLALLGNYGTGASVVLLCIFTAGLVISLLVKTIKQQRVIPVALASGAVACLMLICVNEFYYCPQISLADSVHQATIKITSESQAENGNYYYEAVTSSVDGEKAKVRLRLMFSECPELEPYDEVSGNFNFYVLGKDFEISLKNNKAENRFLGAYAEDGIFSINNIPEAEKPFAYKIVRLRSNIESRLMNLLPNDYGALCTALLLGNKDYLSDRAYGNLKACGITHIICVSGLHISLWTAAVLFILKKLHINEKISCLITGVAVLFLMLLTGMTYSAVRAGIMMLIYLASIILSREKDSLNSLGFALTVIALTNPFAMCSVSLQLSAISTLGVICYSEFIRPKLNFVKKSGTGKNVIDTVLITLIVILFNLPVTLTTYGSFNLLSVPANLLSILPAELCMITAGAGVAVSFIASEIINIPLFCSGIIAKYIIWITEKLSRASFLNFSVSPKYALMLGAAFLFALAFLIIVYWSSGRVNIKCCVCFVLVVVFAVPVCAVMQKRETRVTVFDVGDGLSVLVSKNGENVLVGCGGTSYYGFNTVYYGINDNGGRVDELILPCGEDDCCEYMPKLFESALPKSVYYNSLPVGYDTLTGKTENGSLSDAGITKNIAVDIYNTNGVNAVLISTADADFLICDNPCFDYGKLPEKFRNSDVIIFRSDYSENINNKNLKCIVISADNGRGTQIQNELKQNGVNAVATAECGNIILRAVKGSVKAERG